MYLPSISFPDYVYFLLSLASNHPLQPRKNKYRIHRYEREIKKKKLEDKQVRLLTAKTPPKFILNSFPNFYRRIHHSKQELWFSLWHIDGKYFTPSFRNIDKKYSVIVSNVFFKGILFLTASSCLFFSCTDSP